MDFGTIVIAAIVVAVIAWLVSSSQKSKGCSTRSSSARRTLAETLASDPHDSVREGIAGNPNTPVYLLEKLAEDNEPGVRGFVAHNPSTPIALLEKLSLDEDGLVVNGVAMNTQTPGRTLTELAETTLESRWPGCLIAENPSTPDYLLEKLTFDEDRMVRYGLGRRGQTLGCGEPQSPGRVPRHARKRLQC